MPKIRWKLPFLLCPLLLFVLNCKDTAAFADDYSDVVISNEDETRSRLIMIEGNMYFHAGKDKNISFKVSESSSIMFGKTDIMQLPNQTQVADLLRSVSTSKILLDNLRVTYIVQKRSFVEFLRKFEDLKRKHVLLGEQVKELNDTKNRSKTTRKIKVLILRLSTQIETLLKLMKTDECMELAPCKNGATCVDLFSKYQCLCPDHYEGNNCDQRVDECGMYKDTPAGCQNNASCTNNPSSAGFTCHCPKGFHGHLCQQQKSSCEYSLDLCGEHGHCIPTDTSYKCFCEWGFKVSGDPDNPVCADVDECADNPCYPGATCLNLPGSFKCSSCPKGLMGNGVHCHDFDECANDLTNDCSKSPKVDCINTFGSYKCGACPQDYQGDGFKCDKISRCSPDRNPCASNARCVDGGDEVRCECPENTAGDGLGPEGCLPSNKTVCHADTCLNGGTCFATSDHTYKCSCQYGYLGTHCERPTHCLTKDYCNGRGRCMYSTVGLTYCECDQGFFGPRCQFEEEACGFHSTNETGSILFEKTTMDTIVRRRSCLWYIQLLDSRKVLQINFNNFTIPKLYEVTSKGCESSFGNLTIFDGPDTDAPAIAHLCHGDNTLSLAHPLYTSRNMAVIRLDTRLQSRSTYVSLSWKAVQTRCGGRMTGNQGSISYYDVHDEDNCMWFISVPPQFHIQLTIESLKMASEEFFNCSVNSLEIFDNQVAANRTRISQLCETQPQPVVIKTSGNFAVVYFRLDVNLYINSLIAGERKKLCRQCKIGFSLSYKTIELPTGCGGEIRPDENGVFEGFIESPNYGHAYFANLDCLWVLHASPFSNTTISEESTKAAGQENGPKVGIEFLDFDVTTTVTQYSSSLMWRSLTLTNCRGDYVQIPELNYIFCNHQKPPSTMIVAPTLSIRFHTDSAVSGKGFMLKYQSMCYNEFTAENGTISSSNYPHASTRPFKCTYAITAQSHQAIRMVFNHIGLHTDVATCFYRKDKHKEMQDYIEFSGGHESNEAINKRYVCERYPFVAPGGEIVTSGNRPLKITYSTSGSRENTGFLFDYQIMDVGCGGVFNSESEKKITSPNYPQSYLSHMYCVYYLSVPPGNGLRLAFDSFDVENVANREDCDFDSVRVFDWFVDENSHGEQLGKFCGMNLPPPLLSTAGKMAIVFISDRSVSGAGFSASIQKVDLSIDCDRTFTAPSGDIMFDPNMFNQVTKCDYHIVLPSNHRIMLKFENFSAPCQYSTLTVKNGGSELSPGFPGLFRDSEVCDTHPVQQLQSQSNRLFLRFQSTNVQKSFFKVHYEQFESSCGGYIRGYTGSISAPQYPHQDSRTLSCEWHISASYGNKIRLQFISIDELDSDDGLGMCSHFARNYIDIGDGPTIEENLMKRYCKKELTPMPIDSIYTNELTVQYTQHGGSHHGALFGFLAHFSTVCNGVLLQGHHGTLQSPGFPERVLQSRSCRWTILTSPGSRIRLLFHQFRISDSYPGGGEGDHMRFVPLSLCNNNFLAMGADQLGELKVTAGGVGKSHVNVSGLFPRFCNNVMEPSELVTLSNFVDLTFSSRNEPENHFWLSWITVGCGGSISKNNSQLVVNASSDFTDASVSNVRKCSWDIKAPVGYLINVWIEHMTVTQANSDDFAEPEGIEFHEGLSNQSSIPQKKFNSPLVSTAYAMYSNELFVVFTSHANSTKQMFKKETKDVGLIILNATVTFMPNPNPSGGSVLKVDKSPISIHSPNFPKAYPKGAASVWQFEAPEGYVIAFDLLTYATFRTVHSRTSSQEDRPNEANNNATIECSANMAYLRGALSFFNGPYQNDLNSMTNMRLFKRVCSDIRAPVHFTSATNVSVVSFRGAPYDPLVASGDGGALTLNSPTSSVATASRKPPVIGFQMMVSAKCGGRLYASHERKSLHITNTQYQEKHKCEWEIMRQPPSQDESNALIKMGANVLTVDNNDAEAIYLRIENVRKERMQDTSSTFQVYCNEELRNTIYASDFLMYSGHYLEYSCDSTMRLKLENLYMGAFLISYDTQNTFCGGNSDSHRASITINTLKNPTECEWLIENIAGSHVVLNILSLKLPPSDFCAESYLEIRENNSTGPLIGRFCGTFPAKIERQSIWIRLRHAPTKPSNDEVDQELQRTDNEQYGISIRYVKEYGGDTTSPIIESPPPQSFGGANWHITAKNPENYLRIEFTEFYSNYDDATVLKIYDVLCSKYLDRSSSTYPRCLAFSNSPIILKGSDIMENRVFTISSNVATIVYDMVGQFKLHWQEISPAEVNITVTSAAQSSQLENEGDFPCGNELIPKFEPQTLVSPTNALGRYNNSEKCKWTIRRPRFTGIVLNLTKIDLEEHINCRYDFLTVTTKNFATQRELNEIPEWMRVCNRAQRGSKMAFSYDAEAFVYFSSDRSRAFRGFSIEYYLSCNTFEYIPAEQGALETVLTSPDYPIARRKNDSCFWGIMLESYRDILVESLDMDLGERNSETGKCDADSVHFHDRPYSVDESINNTFCGQEKVNVTMKNGRVFIRYKSSEAHADKRGFKFRVKEIMHDCSTSNLAVDEFVPQRTISSPEFPHMSPNSLNCQWTLSSPPGRRLKLTIDPGTFNLQPSDECTEDYIEIYDGASSYFPLVGRYCSAEPPSTIFSTGSHLHLHYVTDSDIQSMGWNATFELASCGGSLVLRPDVNGSISSPNFPDLYPSKTQCEWTIRAPSGHFVESFVDHLWLASASNCSLDNLAIRDGNSTGRYLLEPVCFQAAVSSSGYRSAHNSAYVKFVSNNTHGKMSRMFCLNRKCGFQMHFTSTKFSCGGTVTDDEGIVYPPGYPDRIIPHVVCQWDFRAGINSRYLLELQFPDNNHEFYEKSLSYLADNAEYCFLDLEVWNGPLSNQNVQYPMFRRFCTNSTVFVSSADIATLLYADFAHDYNSEMYYNRGNRSQFYKPFHVKYTKIDKDFDQNACTYEITKAETIQISDLKLDYGKVISGDVRMPESRGSKSFCHIQVRKPSSEHTTHLEFTDFRAGRKEARVCGSGGNQVRILDEMADPFPIDTALCNGSLRGHNNYSATFVNNQVDVYVLNNPYSFFDGTVSFNLTVTFFECGGVLTSETLEGEMSGEVQSPGFGSGNYTDDQECLWVLQAPEGMVIWLTILTMDIEYHIECSNDFLEVSEGEDRLAVIHRYCNEDTEQLPERFKNIRSHGRTLTLFFKSDATVTRKGFQLTYEFVGYESAACGFHTNALNGTLHSPNFPFDYGPDEECIWDINVPLGYHIRLTFDFFDVVKSVSCEKDFLLVSQEHQSRAMAPVGSYYFYFDHEDLLLHPLCGNEIPDPMNSESNRVRINFTSDATVSGKGFKIRWEAVCGTVFKMNHGIITSPHYPNFYLNDNMECNYLIDPDVNTIQIVTLKVLDFDLDSTSVVPRKGCTSDYLEIRDVLRGVVVLTLCGAEYRETTSSPISIKGAIGVKFVSNTSMIHDTVKGRKNHRGFKISFALADCGGEINLADARNRMSAVITSPGFPLSYHHNLDCLWNVSAPDDKIISYKYTDLDMEMSNECIFDYLEVFDGMEMNNKTRVSKLCGKYAPEGQQKTTGNHLMIRLVTDHSSSKDGFRMVLTATLGPTQGCGGHLVATNQWQTLTPPRGEEHKYFANLRCEWNIRAEYTDSIIKIVLKELEMEEKRGSEPDETLVNNCYDFVAIYDGPKSTSPYLLPPSCVVPEGRELPLTYFSSYRSLDVYFESDSYDEYRGFSFEYMADKAACGGKYLAGEQWDQLSYDSERSLTRTNQRHNRCRFFFYSNVGQPIEILFTEFSFPASSQDCAEEYLEIRDVGSVAECHHPACATNQKGVANTVRTCGKVAPAIFVSTTSVVQITTSVIFQSQYSSTFQLKYQLLSSCNRTITIEIGSSLESGRLTSPNYPNAYNHNSSCTTFLTAPLGRLIFLVFGDFRLERGRHRPPFLRSFDRSWMYGTDASLRGIHQRSGGVGGDAGPFSNNEDRIAISPTDSEASTNCIYDSLSIYFNKSNPTQNTTLCGFSRPASILSEGNKMTLLLQTDTSMAQGGYEAFYYTVHVYSLVQLGEGKMARKQMYELSPIREKQGSLTNIGYPGQYKQNMIQRATIVPPVGLNCAIEVVRAEFTDEDDLENCTSRDHARSATAPIDASLEGQKTRAKSLDWFTWPCKITSTMKLTLPTGSMLLIDFYSDDSPTNDGTGFRLNWKCEDYQTPLL